MSKHFAWVFLVTFLGSADRHRGTALRAAARGGRKETRGVSRNKPDSSQDDGPPRWKWWLHPDSARSLASPINRARRSTRSGSRRRRSCVRSGTSSRSWKRRSPRPSRRTSPDVAVVAQQVEKVEKLRAENNATRTVMIYRIHLLLTPEQRVKVDEIRARMDAGAQAPESGTQATSAERATSPTGRWCLTTFDPSHVSSGGSS